MLAVLAGKCSLEEVLSHCQRFLRNHWERHRRMVVTVLENIGLSYYSGA